MTRIIRRYWGLPWPHNIWWASCDVFHDFTHAGLPARGALASSCLPVDNEKTAGAPLATSCYPTTIITMHLTPTLVPTCLRESPGTVLPTCWEYAENMLAITLPPDWEPMWLGKGKETWLLLLLVLLLCKWYMICLRRIWYQYRKEYSLAQ